MTCNIRSLSLFKIVTHVDLVEVCFVLTRIERARICELYIKIINSGQNV